MFMLIYRQHMFIHFCCLSVCNMVDVSIVNYTCLPVDARKYF